MKSRIAILGLIFLLAGLGCTGNSQSKGKADMMILSDTNDVSKKWALYLRRHLEKRTKDKSILLDEQKEAALAVHISVDATCNHDYCIRQTNKKISITAKTERTMLWLVYQLISYLSVGDKRVDADDLPPAIVSFKTECRDFDFSYREPYFLPNLELEYAPLIGTDMVETSWGLWGHSIDRIVESDSNRSVYAIENGKTNTDQFCFSSPELYLLTKSFIIDRFGDGTKQGVNFMLMPNDNKRVCRCDKCVAAGNTPDNATPAVSNFIVKLANSFPGHSFYTTAYLTTAAPPDKAWPSNTGVMISTIDLPKGIALNSSKATDRFVRLINAWRSKVSRIYIWDYAANFDDWLTPLPILYALQEQLRFFKTQGVDGVFLNGSGYDYSPFDDVKTHVAAALMMDVNASVDNLCRQYFAHFYPVSGKYLADYYLSLERRAQERNKPYDMYGNFRGSLVYDKPDAFVAFYNQLESFIDKASGTEKDKLVKLQTALSFPRLRLALELGSLPYGFARLKDDSMKPHPDIKRYVDRLKRHQSLAIQHYKEMDGSLKEYIEYVENTCDNPIRNRLTGGSLRALSELEEGYNDVKIVQDGLPGYPGDYHQGWMLVKKKSCEFEIQLNPDLQKGKTLRLRFLNDPKHRIHPPEKALLYIDGKIYTELVPDPKDGAQVVDVTTPIHLPDTGTLKISFIKQPEKQTTMAFDEIIIN